LFLVTILRVTTLVIEVTLHKNVIFLNIYVLQLYALSLVLGVLVVDGSMISHFIFVLLLHGFMLIFYLLAGVNIGYQFQQ
jgi:hypothetical protein